MKVWCDHCQDFTILNPRKVCLWCDTKITTKNITRAKIEEAR